jgi:small subunit ribosomal protein S1
VTDNLASPSKLSDRERPLCPEIDSALKNSYLDSQGKVISGTVQRIDYEKDLVFVDVGLKSECVVPFKEFFLPDELSSLQCGDRIEVYLSALDTRAGNVSISRAKAIREIHWAKLKKAFQNDETVQGIAFSRVKGGVSVDFGGVIAFLPGSQIDVRPVKDISNIITKPVEYKILSMDNNQSVIVSRKMVLISERSADRDSFFSSVKEGDVLNGVVKNITNYGAFIDLGDVDGLLHITDISWEKITHPSEVLRVGQEVRVRIVRYDKENKRLSLSMKDSSGDPWLNIASKYPVGTIAKGKVTNIAPYGAFVQLEPGIEGLLHTSVMSWTVKDGNRKLKNLNVDEEIEVAVIDVNMTERRMALSMQPLMENPWEKFAQAYKVGDVLEGVIKNITDFGIFVGIEGLEVDGLIPTSYFNSSQDMAQYNKGDTIEVVYLGSEPKSQRDATDAVKHKTQRIRFGIKQTGGVSLDKYKDMISEGSVVTCKVVSVKTDGIEVELFDSIKCFIKKSRLARERVEQRADKFVVGDRVDAKVLVFDPTINRLSLSIKAHEEDEYNKTVKEYGAADTGATIGCILGKSLSDITKIQEQSENQAEISENDSDQSQMK